tara:strand:+ start:18 stop:677 length:660 start_codon:yes stop_codon:yes gene_type:complete
MFYDNDDKNDKNNSKIFVSLGNYCLTSMILKKNNLKHVSYPFDWMVTKIDNITHTINDNFTQFLNMNNYTKLRNGTINNVYYNNTRTLFTNINCDHQHHDLTNPKDYNYLVRCVERFNKLVDQDSQIIFVMIQPLYISNLAIEEDTYNKLYDSLCYKFGNKIKLLIFNINKRNNDIYNEKKINKNFIIYELKSKMYIGEYGMKWYDKEGIEKFLELINN